MGSALVVAFAFLALYLFSPRSFLCLENDETHAPLFWIPVNGGEAFSLAFRHSYDKAMYIENFKLERGKIFFTGITFKSDLNGQGFIFKRPLVISGGWGMFRGLREKMTSIPFLMGSPDEANHTLLIHKKSYFLVKYATPGTPVALRVIEGRRYMPGLWRIETWMK